MKLSCHQPPQLPFAPKPLFPSLAMMAFCPLFPHPSSSPCTPFLSKPPLWPASAFSIHSEQATKLVYSSHPKTNQTNKKPSIFPATYHSCDIHYWLLHVSRLEVTALLAVCYLIHAKELLSLSHSQVLDRSQHPPPIRPGAEAFQRPTTSAPTAALPYD